MELILENQKTPNLITAWDIKKREYYLVIGRLIP